MVDKVQHQVAVVIGGARGLGLACVKALLEKGNQVVLGDIEAVLGREVETNLQSQYGKENVIFIKCDVTSPTEIKELMMEVMSRYGRLDIFSCPAGTINEINWRKCVDLNLCGVIESTYAALKYMSKAEGGNGGVVVLISSVAAFAPSVCLPVYNATKAALVAFVRSWAGDLNIQTTGVRFSVLCPGVFDTQLVHEVASDKCPILHPEGMIRVRKQYVDGDPALVGQAFMRCVEESELNGQALYVYTDRQGDHIDKVVYTKV